MPGSKIAYARNPLVLDRNRRVFYICNLSEGIGLAGFVRAQAFQQAHGAACAVREAQLRRRLAHANWSVLVVERAVAELRRVNL